MIYLICLASSYAFTTKKIKKNNKSASRQNRPDTAKEKYDNIYCDLFSFEPAKFPKGIEGWSKYLSDSARYPETAQANKTEGKIRIKFTVEEDGSISNVEALNILKDSLTEEAIRLISAGPKWLPARNKGVIVKDYIVQQITFVLNDEEENKTYCDDSVVSKKTLLIL